MNTGAADKPSVPAPPPGLCGRCRHARRIENRRGSVFHMCERSRTDPRFPRYPRLPVLKCIGFELLNADSSRIPDTFEEPE